MSLKTLAAQIISAHGELLESSLNAGERGLLLRGDEEFDSWQRLSQKLGPDLVLLSIDNTRVWWEDGECDVYPGGQIYEKVLPVWSAISRGIWRVESVKEQWKGDELESINFDWKKEIFKLHPNPESSGWIDFELLAPINDLIQESGKAFYSAPTGDQTTYLLVLSEDERAIFENERGWSF